MSDLHRRLSRASDRLRLLGCPSCAHWDVTRVEIIAPPEPEPANVTHLDDDLSTFLARPEKCSQCGRRPPQTTSVVQIIAPDDAESEGA